VIRLPNLAPLLAGIVVLVSHRDAFGQLEAAASVEAVVAARIHSVSVEGSIDPPGRIEALVQTFAGNESPFVASGDADRIGMPLGTIPRLQRILEVAGYTAEITSQPEGDGISLRVRLHAFDRVRRIFVSGNQPKFIGGIRQEDVMGKLSIRPGQKLPPAGTDRDALLTTEAEHVREFLRSQGYWEADARLELHSDGKVPAQINLLVRVHLGPAYPLGLITVTGATALPTDDIASDFRHRYWFWTLPQPFRRVLRRVHFQQRQLQHDLSLARRHRHPEQQPADLNHLSPALED